MAAPATTGQLRTTVSEMKVGDYIKVGSLNGGAWLFNNGTIELPATGIPYANSFANYYFYLIKVANGLLIADRVTQNTGSWDSFNTNKLIQGVAWDTGNIIPTMVSNTSPSGVASASSASNATYDAWKAFNKTTTDSFDSWITNALTTGWLSYDFGTNKIIKKYAITSRNYSDVSTAPKDWTFEGSNDGLSWTVLHYITNQTSWGVAQKRAFLIGNVTAYRYYRINVTTNNGGVNLAIGEIEMMETAGLIRSLTGGVAYADENGNSSATDQSKGAWPTNNEWDKYIVNFPVGKIQAGKTLDDVFHHVQTLCTWTQDTPILARGAATLRVGRGRINGVASTTPASSYSGVDYGFRPVLEYEEV